MKNLSIGLGAVLLTVAVLYFWKPAFVCPQPVDYRKALISLADISLEKNSNDSSKIASLVSYDKQFYMAFFKTELGKEYYYSRHGSCCPCDAGSMSCCECAGGSGLGAPSGVYAELRGLDRNPSVYMLTSNKTVQQTGKNLQLTKKSVGGMDVFLIPASTPVGSYSVQFSGRINLELEIEVLNSDGNFNIVNIR